MITLYIESNFFIDFAKKQDQDIYIYPVGLLGFVPQPNLRLPTTKLVGFKLTFALRPVSPTDSLQVGVNLNNYG
ncbi:hypothetical protein ASL19_12575 [Cylindrospermopsis sp. CR12]|nr:hypothetical protein ASL19_12575 [Cylindrospermopsis sp. CR12]